MYWWTGKAGCKEQIAFTLAANTLSMPAIATTSKMSVGKSVYPNVKPPALIIFR